MPSILTKTKYPPNLSVSFSTLINVQNTFKPNKIARMIQNQIHSLQNINFILEIIWNSGHTDIIDNEIVVKLAKDAITSVNVVQCQVYTMFDIK